MNRMILFVLYFCFLNNNLDAQIVNLFEEEKFSASIGLGLDYGFFGIKGKYFFLQNTGVSFGYGKASENIGWCIGLEQKLIIPKKKKLSPYFIATFGTNSLVHYRSRLIVNSVVIDPLKESFLGFSIGTGMKIRIRDNGRGYLNLGGMYAFVSKRRGEVIREYNASTGRKYNDGGFYFAPSIGFTFVFYDNNRNY